MLTLQKKGHEGGSHLKVQPNVRNSGRVEPGEKPLLPHSLSNIFRPLFFHFFLSWPNVSASVPQTNRQSSQWRCCLAKPNTCSLSFILLLSHSPLSVFFHCPSSTSQIFCLSEGLCWMFCSLEDLLRYHTCESMFFLMEWTLRWFINWGKKHKYKNFGWN